jgi:hypothetical protein
VWYNEIKSENQITTNRKEVIGMRKSQREAQERREQREQMREQLQALEHKERQELQDKQLYERELQRRAQAARRKASTNTKAGGARAGAGRPRKAGDKRQTYTFYGTHKERDEVRRFLQVLREVEQDRETAFMLFQRLSGQTVYELLTSDSVGLPDEKRLIESLMPDLLPSGNDGEENKP